MECWTIYLVLPFILVPLTGLEVDILQDGETKHVPSVLQVKTGATFSLVCKSETCQSNCEGLTWRRRRKGAGSSFDAFSASGSNRLNITNAALDDQGFYDCVDADKTRKVMYLVVRKQGFERESIEIIKNDLASIRSKRSYDPYDSRQGSSYSDLNTDWRKYLNELQDEVEKQNKLYYDNSYYNTNYDYIRNTNKYDTYNTKTHYSGSSKRSNFGIYWGLFGCVTVVALIYTLVKCCTQNGYTDTTPENASRPPPSADYRPPSANYRPPPSATCYHTICRQYSVNQPTVECLYSTAGSSLSTRTVAAHDPFLPSSPLLEVPTAPFLRESGLDEPPTYLESTGNSVASSMTDLNEVEQSHGGQDAVDTCALPPTYEEAVHDIAQGRPEPPRSSNV